jgi:hypothetical protein
MGRSAVRVVTVIVALAPLLTACANTTALTRGGTWQRPAGELTVLLMTPDIEISELTAGGMLEPKAEWTAQARRHFVDSMRDQLAQKKVRLALYERPLDDPEREKADVRLLKLHDAVGGTILVHKLLPQQALPTKDGRFDWTLGAGTRALHERTGADYAVFALVRDAHATAGRAAVMVGAALVGVALPPARQVGFISLVDLRTGDIVWFNRLIDASGDLRTPEPARKAVKGLLDGFPL